MHGSLKKFGNKFKEISLLVFMLSLKNTNKAFGQNYDEFAPVRSEIQNLVKQVKMKNYSKNELTYFPMLKFRTGTDSDSALLKKINRILNIDLLKINNLDELEYIMDFLVEVKNLRNDINRFESIVSKSPPVIYLSDLTKYWEFRRNKQKEKDSIISIDTNNVLSFYSYDFFIYYAKGSKKYEIFIENVKTEPFFDILTDMMSIRENGSDTLAIIKNVIQKIIKADERVRMLAFGYNGLCIARKIWARVNSRLNRIYQNKSIQTSNDSVYVEFFTNDLFKQFGEIYKEYSQKIDSMKIDVNYGNLYSPVVFEEAISIKEYLQKEAKETEPMNKK